jgi:hypothetical protein
MIQQRKQSNTTMLPIAPHASVAIVSTTTPSTGHNKEEGDDFFQSRLKNSNPSHELLKIPHGDPTFGNVVGIGGVGRRDAPAESEAVRFDGRVALAKSEEITSAKEEKKPSFFSPIFRIVAGAAGGLGSGQDPVTYQLVWLPRLIVLFFSVLNFWIETFSGGNSWNVTGCALGFSWLARAASDRMKVSLGTSLFVLFPV